MNENDKSKIFQNIYNYYNNNEKSLIVDLFFGYNEVTYKCLDCNKIYYNYEIFKYIVFPLEEILNIINKEKQDSENDIISIDDCFDIYFSKEEFTKEKTYFCNNCKTSTKCKSNYKIYQSSDILIIILKGDKDIELDFSERINVSQYILNDNNSNCLYDLYGVSMSTYQSERFIATCKDSIDGKWYKYEDKNINEILDFKNEVLKCENPYILFYKRVKQ